LITNKTQVQIEKKKGSYAIEYSLASASEGGLPSWLGGLTENGVSSRPIFHFNHCLYDCLYAGVQGGYCSGRVEREDEGSNVITLDMSHLQYSELPAKGKWS